MKSALIGCALFLPLMPLILDAHEDLAYNIQRFRRDYTRPVAETRHLEANTASIAKTGNALLGWQEYQQGKIGLIFATLYASPRRFNKKHGYRTTEEAHRLYRSQVDIYRRLIDEHPDKFNLLRTAPDLDVILSKWRDAQVGTTPPVGLTLLMEGAEGIRTTDELEMWWELGLRIIGPAWVGTRYCGGWREPGPLTDEGRELLAAMAEHGFLLDLSHMDEAATLEALDRYEGRLIASHSNAAALLPHNESNRHLSDRVIHGIIERDGVIGVVLFNGFLKTGWKLADGKACVTLQDVVAQIDHICQIAGDARHVGIGSDFDGGFGVESVPMEIDTVADLQKIAPLLAERGYTKEDIAAILGENFIRILKETLPAS